MARRARQPAGASASASVPVVVTVAADGGLLDVVGDLSRFTGAEETAAETVQRLLDLLAGEGDAPELIPAIELAPDCFADIHVVVEEDCRHFVLRDVSDTMQALRVRQQAGNELALSHDRERRDSAAVTHGDALAQPRFRGASAVTSLVAGMRLPLLQLAAQTRLLANHCADDAAAQQWIAGIQQAGAQLDALCANALFTFDNAFADDGAMQDTDALAAFVLDTFQLVARVQGVMLEVRAPEVAQPLHLDGVLLRQVMLNLLLHALSDLKQGTLVVALATSTVRSALEVELSSEPAGFDAGRFADLVTAVGAVERVELALCRAALTHMQAKLELVERVTGGFHLWFRVPFDDRGERS